MAAPKRVSWSARINCAAIVRGMLNGKAGAYAGDELDILFEGAEQGDAGAEGRDGISGARSVLTSFARFMSSLSK